MEFGDILRELLEENDISQKQFADDLHIAASTLGNYIRDNREPSFKTLREMAKYFDVSIDYLLDYRHKETVSHDEEHLLQIYRSLTPEFQRILLDQSQALLRHNKE